MKRFLSLAQVAFGLLFILSLFACIMQGFGDKNPLKRLNYEEPVIKRLEEYDASLAHLNSIKNLEEYCDSLYAATYPGSNDNQYDMNYTDVVAAIMRKRFYHGYSRYGFENNFMAVVISRMTVDGYSAIVEPNDILKYPYASCSQQSIVMMELLKHKGMRTRKISFQGKLTGHFCFEVFYNNDWHFYDTNLEPDDALLNSYGRPGVAFLANNTDVLLRAYRQHDKQIILDVFPTYKYGKENIFPAPRAIVLQRSAKFLTYTGWFIFLAAFVLVRRRLFTLTRKLNVRNHRIYFPETTTGASAGYYPGFTASGT